MPHPRVEQLRSTSCLFRGLRLWRTVKKCNSDPAKSLGFSRAKCKSRNPSSTCLYREERKTKKKQKIAPLWRVSHLIFIKVWAPVLNSVIDCSCIWIFSDSLEKRTRKEKENIGGHPFTASARVTSVCSRRTNSPYMYMTQYMPYVNVVWTESLLEIRMWCTSGNVPPVKGRIRQSTFDGPSFLHWRILDGNWTDSVCTWTFWKFFFRDFF